MKQCLTLLLKLHRNPEIPVATIDKPPNFQPQLEMRPYSTAATREESRGAPPYTKGCLTSLGHHQRFPELQVANREEP